MSESWKSEDDDARGYFSFSIGGDESPEQKEKREAERALAALRGDVMWPTLPRFREETRCPKCGSTECALAEWLQATRAACISREFIIWPHETIERSCRRCSFQWYERPLDAREEAP
jgi:predicted nucleic-acid-binding Zn-ribbon protein